MSWTVKSSSLPPRRVNAGAQGLFRRSAAQDRTKFSGHAGTLTSAMAGALMTVQWPGRARQTISRLLSMNRPLAAGPSRQPFACGRHCRRADPGPRAGPHSRHRRRGDGTDGLDLTTRAGMKMHIVALPATFRVVSVIKSKIADIQPGSYIGSAAAPQPDGTLKRARGQRLPTDHEGRRARQLRRGISDRTPA